MGTPLPPPTGAPCTPSSSSVCSLSPSPSPSCTWVTVPMYTTEYTLCTECALCTEYTHCMVCTHFMECTHCTDLWCSTGRESRVSSTDYSVSNGLMGSNGLNTS